MKGESNKNPHRRDWLEVNAFQFGVEAPYNPGSGKPSGHRQHQPIVITREDDEASPQLYTALCNNETLESVVIEVVDQTPAGNEIVVETITLADARIVNASLHLGRGPRQSRRFMDFTIDVPLEFR